MEVIEKKPEDKEINAAYQSITVDHLFLYHIIGILPYGVDDEPNISRRRLKTLASLAWCFSSGVICFSMYLVYGVRMLLDYRFEIDFVIDLVVIHGIVQRHLLLYLQRRDLLELTRICRELWDTFVTNNENERSVVRGYVRNAHYLRQFFVASGATTLALYLIWGTQFAPRVPVTSHDDSNLTLCRRMLPLKFYVEVYEEPWYSLVTILQGTVAGTLAIVLTGIETVGPFFGMMACGYLRTVRDRLMSMAVNDKDKDHRQNGSMLQDLIVCIKFHQKILHFCVKIGRYTRFLFMIQVSCTLYNMSLIGFKLLVSDDGVSKSISMMLMTLGQFFGCQWISQYLINESEAISTAAYAAVKMHRPLNVVANRMLQLMILRADKPIQLTASGIIRLSYESFQRLLVNAFSMFTVLRSFLA